MRSRHFARFTSDVRAVSMDCGDGVESALEAPCCLTGCEFWDALARPATLRRWGVNLAI